MRLGRLALNLRLSLKVLYGSHSEKTACSKEIAYP
jgi:hypothetical protein